MKKKLKFFYQTTSLHKYLFWIVELPYYLKKYFVSDDDFIQQRYRKIFKKDGDFKNPTTLNEIISYRKLYDKKDFYTLCSDKYEVREIVKNCIGEKYLIPLLGVFNCSDDINFTKLPNSFVIKINHGSGQNIIVKTKDDLNISQVKNQLDYWMRKNHYYNSREWQYKNIKPKIIFEKLMLDDNGKVPYDYKFHCINGKLEFIQIDADRFDTHKRIFYSKDWEVMPFIWSPVLKDGTEKYKKAEPQTKPKVLDEMIEIVEKLAKPFYYIRVDLYLLEGKIYFGELTFSHGSGTEVFFLNKWDKIYGDKVDLEYRK